jgi:hypothetical protein
MKHSIIFSFQISQVNYIDLIEVPPQHAVLSQLGIYIHK